MHCAGGCVAELLLIGKEIKLSIVYPSIPSVVERCKVTSKNTLECRFTSHMGDVRPSCPFIDFFLNWQPCTLKQVLQKHLFVLGRLNFLDQHAIPVNDDTGGQSCLPSQ